MKNIKGKIFLSTTDIKNPKRLRSLALSYDKSPIKAIINLQNQVYKNHNDAIEGLRVLKVSHHKFLAYGTAIDINNN